jgi:hypothetical protein
VCPTIELFSKFQLGEGGCLRIGPFCVVETPMQLGLVVLVVLVILVEQQNGFANNGNNQIDNNGEGRSFSESFFNFIARDPDC